MCALYLLAFEACMFIKIILKQNEHKPKKKSNTKQQQQQQKKERKKQPKRKRAIPFFAWIAH